MDAEIQEVENGTRIYVETDHEVAIVVEEENGERIYLPDVSGEDSTYYAEEVESLVNTSNGYSVTHPGEVEDVTVLG